MKHYLIFKNEDNSVYSSVSQVFEPLVPDDCWAMEVDLDVYTYFQNYISSPDEFSNKQMIYNTGTKELELYERPKVPVDVNKTSILSNGIDYVKISNIPVGSRMVISNMTEFIVDDGEFILTTRIPGDIKITIYKEYYSPKEVLINAT